MRTLVLAFAGRTYHIVENLMLRIKFAKADQVCFFYALRIAVVELSDHIAGVILTPLCANEFDTITGSLYISKEQKVTINFSPW